MSEISKSNQTPLNPSLLLEEYRAGRGSVNGQMQMGIETESWFIDSAAARQGRIDMMTPARSQRVLERLSACPETTVACEKAGQRLPGRAADAPLVLVNTGGASYQLELCGVIEVATAPGPAADIGGQISRLRTARANLSAAAAAEGLDGLRWAVPASITTGMCTPNRVQRERLQAEWAKFEAQGADNPGLRTMGLATSTQVSLSYRDPQEAAEIITLGNLLSPVLYAVFANTPGYIEGTSSPVMPRPLWWQQHNRLAPRAGIPAPILRRMFDDQQPGDMLGDWVDYVRTVPMVYHLGASGQPVFETSPSFNDLARRGLGTASNFALAESLVWPDVKVIGGQRIELRMCDAGPWQGEALAVLASGLFARPDLRRDAISALKAFNRLEASGLQTSLDAVARLNFAAPYGRRTIAAQLPLLSDFLNAGMSRLEIPAGSTTRLEEVLASGQSDFVRARGCLKKGAVQADLAGVMPLRPA